MRQIAKTFFKLRTANFTNLTRGNASTTNGCRCVISDGPNRVFSGGPLESGELYSGPEPDWSFVNEIPTIEMQLMTPPKSRVIWTVEHNSKLYVWSGYMGTTVGRMWKQWPIQAERDGKALIRVNGVRYERQLARIKAGEELTGIAAAITNKYPSRTTREGIEAGDVWLFEAGPAD